MNPALAPDDRPLIRVFIASSIELAEERRALDELIEGELADRPDLARSFRFVCLRWDEDAAPGPKPLGINDQIDRSLDLDDVDIVIALLWRKIGEGTRQEIERTRERFLRQSRPSLLVYRKRGPNQEPENEAVLRDREAVDTFCRSLVDRDQIVTSFDGIEALIERVRAHLPALLPIPRKVGEPGSPLLLARWLLRSGLASAAMTAATLLLTTRMSFPDRRVGFWTVLCVLAAPPILAVSGLATRWLFGRLLDSFVRAWCSSAYRDADLYRAFQLFLPTHLLPPRLRRQLATGLASNTLRWSLTVTLLGAPLIGQYSALFEEILLWPVMVGEDIVLGAGAPPNAPLSPLGKPCGTEPAANKEPVETCYVDTRAGGRWPLGLRNPVVRDKYLRAGAIFVHAANKFDEGWGPGERWRANRGPQIFLPWQPALYLLLFAGSGLAWLHGLWRLARIARELRPATRPAASS